MRGKQSHCGASNVATDTHELLIYRPATLVFRTVHWDKAGESSGQIVVTAQVADVMADGVALAVIDDGIPVHVPVTKLYPIESSSAPANGPAFIGGHELIRDFHPAQGKPNTAIRWLERSEVEELLANASQN